MYIFIRYYNKKNGKREHKDKSKLVTSREKIFLIIFSRF